LRARLQEACRRRQRIQRTAQVLLLGAGALLAGFGAFVLDYLTSFPMAMRLATTLAIVGVFSWWLPRRQRARFRPPADDLAFAREVERLAERAAPGGFGSLLVSALEFSAGRGTGSRELRGRAIAEAGGPRFDPRRLRLYDVRFMRRTLTAVAVCLLVYGTWLAASPATLGIFLARAVGLPVPYPTRTQLLAVDYPPVAAMHQPVTVRIRAGGVIPAGGRLRIRHQDESPFHVDLEPDEAPGSFRCEIREPARSFTFAIRLGDVRSPEHAVTVVRPPFVAQGEVVVRPPPYTGQAEQTLALGALEILANSQADLLLTADRPVRTCELEIDGERLPLAREGDRWVLRRWLVKQGGRYAIRLVDADGIENLDRIHYPLDLREDSLPTVRLDRPREGSHYAPASKMKWTIGAVDDFAVAEMALDYTVGTRDETGQIRPLRQGSVPMAIPAGRRDLAMEGVLDLLTLNLSPGVSVVFQARARDTSVYRSADEAGVSAPVTVHIVSAAELRTIIAQEMNHVHQMVEDIQTDMKHHARMIDMKSKE
jgi:hypothetical protein